MDFQSLLVYTIHYVRTSSEHQQSLQGDHHGQDRDRSRGLAGWWHPPPQPLGDLVNWQASVWAIATLGVIA
jgi:hypothetical protein